MLAENYLQHAEHYFRIVAAAQPQNQFRPDQGGQVQDSDDDDDFPPMNDRFASPEPLQRFQQPQPHEHEHVASDGEASESGETENFATAAPAAPADPSAAAEDGQAASGEGDGRRHRERSRRRRGRTAADGAPSGADPAEAPQPDVGELPAFLTAGGPTTAAE